MSREYESVDMKKWVSTGNRQYSEAFNCGKSSWQSGSFHGGGDTYKNQEMYVRGLGNKWAMENFNATRPYFSGD